MLKNQLLNPPAKAGVFSTSNRMKKPQMKLLDKTLKIDQNTAQGTESSVHPKRDSKLQRRCTTPTNHTKHSKTYNGTTSFVSIYWLSNANNKLARIMEPFGCLWNLF
jgi:hypothetical protein